MNIFKKLGIFLRDGFISFLGIFTETSPTSLMRFMSFFLFVFTLFETHYIIKSYGVSLSTNHITIIGILLAFSFFPKVVQKVIEKKYDVLEKKIKADSEKEKVQQKPDELLLG